MLECFFSDVACVSFNPNPQVFSIYVAFAT
jgi:hypothetical protein